MALFLQDKKRQDLIKEKQAEKKAKEEAAKAKETVKEKPKGDGATIEEIDDEEAKKIEF